MQHFVIKCCILTFTNNIGTWENYFIGKLNFFANHFGHHFGQIANSPPDSFLFACKISFI